MTNDTPTETIPTHKDLVIERLVMWHFVMALLFLLAAMLSGLLMALQLVNWNPFTNIELMSPGRWRMFHTNAIAYGFLANAFVGALYWVVPRLTLHQVASKKLSYVIFGVWQVLIVLTLVGIVVGPTLQAEGWVEDLARQTNIAMSLGAQGVEWGETPFWVDPFILLGLGLVAINFFHPILKVKGPMYVTLWYFMAAFVWTFLTYAMGNLLPEYYLAGTSGGAVAGLFIHDLVGLFITPLGWGLMYYFVPIMLKKPVWSHGLSLVGFWGLAFFYPLNGIHHFLYSPIPMFLQYGAIIATIAVEVVVTTVIINFIGTLWGNTEAVKTNMPIRWFYTGMVFYFLTCSQCALQVTLTFQQLIHFTDWVVGHAHMVMFGVFSFWLFGIMVFVIPKILKKSWYSKAALEWHYWLTTVGLTVMIVDLVFAGIFQGYSWASLQPWEDSIAISMPFWVLRVFAGLTMFLGYIVFLGNLTLTYFCKAKGSEETSEDASVSPATA